MYDLAFRKMEEKLAQRCHEKSVTYIGPQSSNDTAKTTQERHDDLNAECKVAAQKSKRYDATFKTMKEKLQ